MLVINKVYATCSALFKKFLTFPNSFNLEGGRRAGGGEEGGEGGRGGGGVHAEFYMELAFGHWKLSTV